MKVTRLVGLAALAAAGCTVLPPEPADALRLRAPNLERPLSETHPPPSRPEDPVKLAVWERINADRAAAGLSAVAWDEAASRAADDFCGEQIREGTNGHFLTNGVPPYARVTFAGIFGVPTENAVSWKSSGTRFESSTVDLALSGQTNMMAEVPPADGHRRTILDPDATHVGVGYAQKHGNFRMAQEFLTRRLAELTLQRVAADPETVLVKGRTLAVFRPEFVTLAHEPSPHPLTRAEASARESYRYPIPGLAYVPVGIKSLHVVGTQTEDALHVDPSGEFSFRFTPRLPGLWTILIYAGRGRESPVPGGLAVLWVERAAARER